MNITSKILILAPVKPTLEISQDVFKNSLILSVEYSFWIATI